MVEVHDWTPLEKALWTAVEEIEKCLEEKHDEPGYFDANNEHTSTDEEKDLYAILSAYYRLMERRRNHPDYYRKEA